MSEFKNFQDIINSLNQKIKRSGSLLKTFQADRSTFYKRSVGSYNFFNNGSEIQNRGYTFHIGGSNEFQFNVGSEGVHDGINVFRYGIAISLHKTQTLKSPLQDQEEKIIRFNQLLKRHPTYFKDEDMWIWNEKGRNLLPKVSSIQMDTLNVENFIFIGKYFNKTFDEINSDDLDAIIDELEYLYPVYRYVQFQEDDAIKMEKVARICYNDQGWIKPSGLNGKSENKKAYERQYGFGHEEWLLDFDKMINGYHYAALQPIHKFRKKYIGEVFNIHLYTIGGQSKTRYWIGKLSNVEVISVEKSKEILEEYKKREWYDEMKADLHYAAETLESAKLAIEQIDEWAENGDLFNVRFTVNDYVPVPTTTEVSQFDKAIPIARYTLLNWRKNPDGWQENEDFQLDEKRPNRKLKDKTRKPPAKSDVEIELLHNKMSLSLEKYLDKHYAVVRAENSTGLGTRIDMVSKEGEDLTFYEIKTYATVKQSLRSAIGQLFEYAFYPDRSLAKNLIVVSHLAPKNQDRKYVQHLRKTTGLDLKYWHFDHEKGIVVEEV